MISMEQITRWESEAEGYLGNEVPAPLLMSKAEQQEFARRQIALIAELQDLRREQTANYWRGKVLMQKLYQTIDKFEHPPSDDLWVITANLMGQLGDLFHELQEDEEEGDPDD